MQLLWKEDFTVTAVTVRTMSSPECLMLGAPQLAGKAALVACLSRSNAVTHLENVITESGGYQYTTTLTLPRSCIPHATVPMII